MTAGSRASFGLQGVEAPAEGPDGDGRSGSGVGKLAAATPDTSGGSSAGPATTPTPGRHEQAYEPRRHRCGHSWNHRWQWMRWFCNMCKHGGYITLAEHQATGRFGAGDRCLICWPPGSHPNDDPDIVAALS